MKQKKGMLAAITVIAAMVLSACATSSADVASISGAEETKAVAPSADAADILAGNEAKMIALTQCLRDQGLQVRDPVVDSDGNVSKPDIVEGGEMSKKDWGPIWEACEHHLEGFVWEQKRVDRSKELDWYLALATCLGEKGYDMIEPTEGTLDQWMGDFKQTFDWKDPKAMRDYQECSGEGTGQGQGK